MTSYLVRALEKGVSTEDAFDFNVKVFSRREDAEKCCKELEHENADDIKKWNTYGCKCIVGTAAFEDDGDDAKAALRECKKLNCPYAMNMHIAEVFYGDDSKSGGFEVVCDGKKDRCCQPSEYTYAIEEIEYE